MSSDPWIWAAASGVALELTGEPVQTTSPGRRPMSAGQETALEAEAKALREKDVIYEAPDPQRNFLSPLFAVPKADGKIRPVVDLRALNAWLEYHHFKMEGIPALQDLLERGDFLAKVDLKEAYLTVPIAKEHHHLLGSEWRNRTYQFRALPFGLASAPFTPTKVLHPVRQELTVRQLASCIGMLGAAWPGVLPAPPHLRGLQRLLAGASRQRLPWEARTRLNQETRQDLAWWVRHHQGSAESQLNRTLFKRIQHLFRPSRTELFATRINAQLEQFVSWLPEPSAVATDAFALDWRNPDGYAFPPFSLLSRVINQVRRQRVPTLVLETPLWRGATWFPQLLGVAVAPPVLLPQWPDLLLDQLGQSHPLVERRQLVLAVWLIYGQPTRQRNFPRQCPGFCWHHGEREPVVLFWCLRRIELNEKHRTESLYTQRLLRC